MPVAPLTPRPVFYLHGFASSAKSTKASFLGGELQRLGVTLRCPDFNAPDFETLTLTRMLDQLDRELAAAGTEPAVLIGSSLGGTLAILAAERFGARIDRLVLLAPAVLFAKEGHHVLPPERIAEWKRAGRLPFFHYGDNRERLLDYAFYEDTFRYNSFEAAFTQPALVFQGLRDAAVDPRSVEAFARTRPNVTLSLLEDDHQLIKSLPRIWDGVRAFLDLA